jgi:membrane associated rhomboid family serine protease
MAPRRGFNSKFDSFLENLLERMPGGNIAALVVFLNTLFYGAYLMWPKWNIHSYFNHFTFNLYGLNKGYLHSLFTCHFAHQSFFSWLIDSVIIFLLCQSLGMMYGQLFVAKTVVLSMLLGSFFLFAYHNTQGGMVRPFQGNDAILRGIIFSIIFTNPQQTFMLFPIPISIPAWTVALLLLGIDFLQFNVAAFGGVSASYMMVNYLM